MCKFLVRLRPTRMFSFEVQLKQDVERAMGGSVVAYQRSEKVSRSGGQGRRDLKKSIPSLCGCSWHKAGREVRASMFRLRRRVVGYQLAMSNSKYFIPRL